MRKRITAFFATLVLALSIMLVGAAPASAGTCTVITSSWHLCGTVKAIGSCGVKISNNWPASAGTIKTLYNNQSSTRYFRDTDAWMIPTKCKTGIAVPKGVWKKLRDGQNITAYAR